MTPMRVKVTKKTGFALFAIFGVFLIATAFLSAAGAVPAAMAASALAAKVNGCSPGVAPPNLVQLYSYLPLGTDGWTVQKFNVSSFSQTPDSLHIADLDFIGTLDQTYGWGTSYANGTVVSHRIVTTTQAQVHLSSLDLTRNSTTLSGSMTGFSASVIQRSNSSGPWQTTSQSFSDSDLQFSWSCTQS